MKPSDNKPVHDPRPADSKGEMRAKGSKKPTKGKWKIDHYVASTVALVFISLCALFVSMYQTRVLSQQQEVMSAQQEIMMRNAKAQLWPNLEVGRVSGYRGNTVEELQFEVKNTGTGPAIVEGVTVSYDGQYAASWWDMWSLADLPDSIPRTISNEIVAGRVIQAGEQFPCLSLNDNQPLMEFLAREIKNQRGPVITVCYRSVFDEHWLLEREMWGVDYRRARPIEACAIADSIAFNN